MRIISGTARGRRLFAPADGRQTIRPTADRAREALFSIIGPSIIGSTVVDLFAGTGAFGCEALSRGAAHVLFIDNHRAALRLIAKNIALINNGPQRSSVRQADLARGGRSLLDSCKQLSFDVVFIDPPYGKRLADTVLKDLDTSSRCHEQTLIIVEEQSSYVPPTDLVRLTPVDRRRYGAALFTFFRIRSDS
ncbi:16S rRNA (guanine(966)-N(2))-methyltransferase RsmD [Desulfofustis limnaeus]|uniref:Methyltransferase n=1 Tax=Desulfofustis limnaeus TaxID=2740163 RepID=A0ABM7W780_9BACT|nr:16S rRNA (guanine(966)-N(2))-methyltransferase RsmD [Desulfofustis limnaeus]BDD86743.1 methyltransferase [Desulfofustis limnaeus]